MQRLRRFAIALASNSADLTRDGLGLAGAALIAAGAWRIYEPAGLITAGFFLLIGAWLSARSAAE